MIRFVASLAGSIFLFAASTCSPAAGPRSAASPGPDSVRLLRSSDELARCSYLRTVSAAEQPYREGVTVFEQLKVAAYRAGGDALQVRLVEGNPAGRTSAGPTNAMTARVYRCNEPGARPPALD